MSGVGLFTSLFASFFYIGLPVLVILLILWLYRIKQNTDIHVEQNKEIIQLLKNIANKDNNEFR